MRLDGRRQDEARAVKITPDYLKHAEGSCLFELGQTKIICAASFDDKVPGFIEGTGKGWVTAEYAMLPRATHTRNTRESKTGRPSGRSQEIQRLIGRALRAVVDRRKLGENSLLIDCDVLQADGGTRTASICGAYVALSLACQRLVKRGDLQANPVIQGVAALSVGMKEGQIMLDLNYDEDFACDVDMNVVTTADGAIVEVQGTAEGATFSIDQMKRMVELACEGCRGVFAEQGRIIQAATK